MDIINGVDLLSIEKLKIENEECIPGYLLFPLGYCVIASTLYGDVYCIERNCELNDSNVFMASYEEIYEGLTDNQINESIVKVCNNFYIKTCTELHLILKEKLGFPNFYGINWDAFWDEITGLVEMPRKLVFYGW